MAPIVKGPYYAIKMMIGDIGTFAGLKVDGEGRALSGDGEAIPGLYAVGNDACSIMGGNYPGAGITLGPALTFGYIAGRSLAAGARRRRRHERGARIAAGQAGAGHRRGQGNGRAIALGLAAAGARVVVTDVDAGNARKAADDILAAGGQACAHALDVTDPRACEAIAAAVRQAQGPIDVLVNNAGILIREGIDSPRAAENWRRVLDVNLNGGFNMIHAFLDALRATRGVIINVGSIASFAGGVDPGLLAVKGGVKMMTQAMARDLAPDGIRVNAIAPGVIETPMTQYTRDDPARLASFMQRIPLGRVGQPQDLAAPSFSWHRPWRPT